MRVSLITGFYCKCFFLTALNIQLAGGCGVVFLVLASRKNLQNPAVLFSFAIYILNQLDREASTPVKFKQEQFVSFLKCKQPAVT